LEYDAGWDYESFGYADFWTIPGFIRNLFYNGFHPVVPWVAFMLFGLWFGRHDLTDKRFLKRTMSVSLIVFLVIQLISNGLIFVLSGGNQGTASELALIFGTSPMPPLPTYMFSGSAIAIFIISSCILIAHKFENSPIIKALTKTGQLALTFYVAHVIIGMGIAELLNPDKVGKHPLEFSVAYAILFSALCILFALFWTKNKKAGPLEWIMRKIAG